MGSNAERAEAGRLLPYIVQIGTKQHTRLDFGCMAESAAAAFVQHVDLAEIGERVEIIPVRQQAPIEADLQAWRVARVV